MWQLFQPLLACLSDGPFLLKFNMTLLDVFHQELHDKDGNI